MQRIPQHAREAVENCLRALADGELQQRTWVEGRPGGPASPSELVSQLFDDTALTEYLGGRGSQPTFSAAIDALLNAISALVDSLDLSMSPTRLLRDSRWLDVQRMAAEAAALIANNSR